MKKYDIDLQAQNQWAKELEKISSLKADEQIVANSITEGGHRFVAEKGHISEKVQSFRSVMFATEGHEKVRTEIENLGVFPSGPTESFLLKLEARQLAAHSRGEIQFDPSLLKNNDDFTQLVLPTMLGRDSQITKINGIDTKELRAHAEEHGIESATKVIQSHQIGQNPEKAFEAGREFSRIKEEQDKKHQLDVEERRNKKDPDRDR